MTDESLCVLVTGATGFIGSRLVPALLEQGHRVKAMTRHPDDYDGPGEPVGGDVFDPGTLAEPMDGVDVAVYLCLLYTSPSPRDGLLSRMPSSA